MNDPPCTSVFGSIIRRGSLRRAPDKTAVCQPRPSCRKRGSVTKSTQNPLYVSCARAFLRTNHRNKLTCERKALARRTPETNISPGNRNGQDEWKGFESAQNNDNEAGIYPGIVGHADRWCTASWAASSEGERTCEMTGCRIGSVVRYYD